LPGVGFDVVPSDCLAAHLARRLPNAAHLALAFRSLGDASRGTLTTMVENLGSPGAVRRDGMWSLLADFVAEVLCRYPRTMIHPSMD
jgi:short subunit dehydrogenase-like uncharacterized protein